MRNLLIALVCCAFIPLNESLADDEFSAGAEIEIYTRYVWRGVALTEGPVLQPSVWASAFDFTLTVWNNVNLAHEEGQGRYNETDLILEYEREIGRYLLEPSVEFYFYPNQQDEPATGLANLKLSRPLGPLSAFTLHSFDIARYTGAYYGEAGVSFSREFSPRHSIEAAARLAWASSRFNEVYFGLPGAAANHMAFSVDWTYGLSDHFYVKPRFETSVLLDAGLRGAAGDTEAVSLGLVFGAGI